MYCMKCGRELQEGVPCPCTQEQQVVEQNVVEQEVVNENVNSQEEQQAVNDNLNENVQTEQPKKENKVDFSNLLKNLGLIFIKPATAIKDAVGNKRWLDGLIYILIFSIISAMLAVVSYTWDDLEYYNSRIDAAKETYKEAKEDYEEAKEDYLLNDSYYNELRVNRTEALVETAEGLVDKAREKRIDELTSFSFIMGGIGVFIQKFISPIVIVLIISALLLLVGKVFKGNGSFTQALAGVGLSYNIKYLSSMILPLLARIPFIGDVFSTAITGISAIFGIYIYLVAKETFEIDEDKSILAVFLGIWVATLVSRIILAI